VRRVFSRKPGGFSGELLIKILVTASEAKQSTRRMDCHGPAALAIPRIWRFAIFPLALASPLRMIPKVGRQVKGGFSVSPPAALFLHAF
jgi:hypothetical protein